MNEMIKQLFVKSGGIVEVCDVTQDEVLTYTHEMDVEKFAQLIVKECMDVCEKLGDKGQDGHYCADTIRSKFGIKFGLEA